VTESFINLTFLDVANCSISERVSQPFASSCFLNEVHVNVDRRSECVHAFMFTQ
jgi:hypothetical protein